MGAYSDEMNGVSSVDAAFFEATKGAWMNGSVAAEVCSQLLIFVLRSGFSRVLGLAAVSYLGF